MVCIANMENFLIPKIIVCLCLGLYGPINNEIMSSQSVKCGTVPGQA